MGAENDHRENRYGHGIPVEKAYIASRPKVAKERHREVALAIERDSTDQVACRGAEEGSQQEAG